jgi:hypothetical protein
MRKILFGAALFASYVGLAASAYARPPAPVATKAGNSFTTEVIQGPLNDLSARAGMPTKIKVSYKDATNKFGGAHQIHAWLGVGTLTPDQTKMSGGTESMKGHNITLHLDKKTGEYVGNLKMKLATNGGARAEKITRVRHAFSDVSKLRWDSKGTIGDDYEVGFDNK